MHDMSRHKGTAKFTIMDKQIPLSVQNSIIGRAVVVHGDPYDLGRGGHELSESTGNAGGAELLVVLLGMNWCSQNRSSIVVVLSPAK